MKMYDVVIIGTGPAGYTAALYSARYRLDTLLVGMMPGGMISEAPDVCNFPSYDNINGMDLAMKMEEQVRSLDVEVVYDSVENVQGVNNDFTVKAGMGEYKARKVILATGQERRRLHLEREKELTGKGVSYCATCDAAFYRDKTVGVIGGGNAALAAALLLSRYADGVMIFYRREQFTRPEPIRILEVEQEVKIKTVFGVNIAKLLGQDRLRGVELDDGNTYDLDGLFVEIGSTPNSQLARNMGVDVTEEGYIAADTFRRTNIHGIYAAGDVIASPLKQAVTAAGQGAEAADSAYQDIQREKVTGAGKDE